MTVTVANNSKKGYYDSVRHKVHTGERMKMSENIGFLAYYSPYFVFNNVVKSGGYLSIDTDRLDSNGYVNDSLGWNYLVFGPRDPYPTTWVQPGTWTLRWNGTANLFFNVEAGKTVSADITTDRLSGASLGVGVNTGVQFTTTGTLPGGLAENETYYVVDSDATGIQVSPVKNGTPVNLTTVGSGQHKMYWMQKKGNVTYPGYDHAVEYEIYGDTCGSNTWIKFTGGIGTVTKLEFIMPDEVARHDAGHICCQRFVDDMYGIDSFRNLGLYRVNDNCGDMNYSELKDWDYITWNTSQVGRIIAKIANECNSDPWICVPHQFTDAACTAYANDLLTHLDPERKVYVEYSNEVWNTAPAFKDQYSWAKRIDVTHVDAVCNPATREITSTAHGLSTGDLIFCYANNTARDNNSFVAGAYYTMIRVDADTLRFGYSYGGYDTLTNITQANPAVVTSVGHGYSNGDEVRIYDVSGMTEVNDLDFTVANATADTFELSGIDASAYTLYTSGGKMLKTGAALNDGVTLIRYKDQSSTLGEGEGYAIRSAEVWALFKAVLGSRMYAVGAGQRVNTTWCSIHYNNEDFRDNIDYYAISSYWKFTDWKDLGTDNGSAASYTSMTDTTASYVTDELVGELLVNLTDGSWGTITSNSPTVITCSGGFTGGTENYFNAGDSYKVSYYGNKTTEELTQHLIDTHGPGVKQQQQNHINVIGSARNLINYEGGDASGGNPGTDAVQPEQDKVEEWARSKDCEIWHNYWTKQLSEVGVKVFCHHVMYGEQNGVNTWGKMEHTGDTDSAKYLGMLEFYRNGGAPKP